MSRRLVVAASSSQSDDDVYDVYDDDDDDQKPRAFLLCPRAERDWTRTRGNGKLFKKTTTTGERRSAEWF